MMESKVGSAETEEKSSAWEVINVKKEQQKKQLGCEIEGKKSRVIFKMQTSHLINQVELPDEFISHK